MARTHYLPVTHRGERVFYSVSHTTAGFGRVLEMGYAGLEKQIRDSVARLSAEKRDVSVLQGMLACLEAASLWHGRYLEELSARIAGSAGPERENYINLYENLHKGNDVLSAKELFLAVTANL